MLAVVARLRGVKTRKNGDVSSPVTQRWSFCGRVWQRWQVIVRSTVNDMFSWQTSTWFVTWSSLEFIVCIYNWSGKLYCLVITVNGRAPIRFAMDLLNCDCSTDP